jgi:hypothetical protein
MKHCRALAERQVFQLQDQIVWNPRSENDAAAGVTVVAAVTAWGSEASESLF